MQKFIEIICVGDELVEGQVHDRNAYFMAAKFFLKGMHIERICFIRDTKEAIKEQVEKSLATADIVLLSGGMGHTLDDCTKGVIANIFDQELVKDKTIEKDLLERFSSDLKSLDHQSLVFSEGDAYPNPIGTAPMLTLALQEKLLCLLPGVPRELEAIAQKHLLPLLEKTSTCKQKICEKIYFCLTKEEDIDPYVRNLAKKYPDMRFGIYPQGKTVMLSIISGNAIPKDLIACIQKDCPTSFRASTGRIEEALLHLLVEKKMRITFAESCSGGALASRFTKISGASNALDASFVTYSDAMKHNLLGVEMKILENRGAVSDAVVRQMAKGALTKSKASVAIAVSGIAGPSGASIDKPLGTCFVCFAFDQGPVFSGLLPIRKYINREQMIQDVATYCFSTLYLYLKSGQEPIFVQNT